MLKQSSPIIKIVLALIVFVAFGEWGLRFFKNQVHFFYPAGKTFPPIYTQSDTQAFALKPGTEVIHYNYFNEFTKNYRINAKGLRGRTEFGNIVMLGDSMVFGIGLNDDETISYYLEEISGAKVINAGVPGYSIDNAYVALQKYDPEKITIVGFFLANDVTDLKNHDWIVDGRGLPLKIIHKKFCVDPYGHLSEKHSSVFPMKEFLRNHSFFYTVLSERRHVLKWKIETVLRILKNKKDEEPKENPVVHFKEDEYAIKVKRLFSAIKKERRKFLVLVISNRKPDIAAAELEKYMLDFFKDENIHFVRSPHKPDTLYYAKDCHLTVRGAESTAAAIHEKLRDLCWL